MGLGAIAATNDQSEIKANPSARSGLLMDQGKIYSCPNSCKAFVGRDESIFNSRYCRSRTACSLRGTDVR